MRNEKSVYRPNSVYCIVCCTIIGIFGGLIVIWSFLDLPNEMKYLIGRICAAILSFFSFGSILFIFNLKFVFYEDYLIVPNGTYREYLKKKDRIIVNGIIKV